MSITRHTKEKFIAYTSMAKPASRLNKPSTASIIHLAIHISIDVNLSAHCFPAQIENFEFVRPVGQDAANEHRCKKKKRESVVAVVLLLPLFILSPAECIMYVIVVVGRAGGRAARQAGRQAGRRPHPLFLAFFIIFFFQLFSFWFKDWRSILFVMWLVGEWLPNRPAANSAPADLAKLLTEFSPCAKNKEEKKKEGEYGHE